MNAKTILSQLRSLLAILLFLAAPAAKAQFTYTTNGGTITINGYTGSGGAVTIPLTINGLPVTRIGNSAFINDTSLTSVTIPDSVTSIQQNAFEYCSSLTSIYFNGNAPAAGSTVFSGDNNATVYYLPGATGWSNTFAGRPAVMEGVGEAEFSYTTSGKAIIITGYSGPNVVVIPSAINGLPVTSIGAGAFNDLTSLASVTIPEGVLSIGSNAFAFCGSLTNVTFPASVTNLGENVFLGSGLTSATIPNSITAIPGNAFEYCTNLASVIIPESVTNIESNAFAFCGGLTNVTIPASVTNIGNNAFGYCGGLTSLTIPGSVHNMGNSAFANCPNLASVTLADGVTSIGTNAFAFCGSLTNVTIPASVTNIWQYAFFECSNLTSVTIPDSVIALSYEAFSGSGLTSVTIPDSVTNIGESAFFSCSNLASVTIPHSVRSIADDTFAYCTSLANVTISNGVISIGVEAFAYCSSLVSVTIPDSITNIGESAFHSCSSLASVTIPQSVRTIGDEAFEYCIGLTDLTISNGVFSIGEDAFAYCAGLASVTLPGGVTNIGEGAFYSCSSLASVTIPSSLRTIQEDTFASCPSLANVTITNGITSIAESAFNSCSSLASIAIPASVRSLGEWAFADCADLTSVNFKGDAPSADSTVFSGDNNATVYYLAGTSGWSNPFAGRPAVDPPNTGSLQVTLGPAAANAAGAQWQVDGGTWQGSAATLGNLSVGNHTLGFNGTSGWTTPANQTVEIKANSVAEAKGTYTFSAQGIFNGLFMQADATEETAGMLRGLDVTASGTYSGTLLLGASTNAISGGFDSSGHASNLVARAAEQGGPLTVEMTLNWNDSPPDITGTVSGANGGVWTANLRAELAVNGSSSAEYTALLCPAGTPPGYGYILMTNDAGALTLSVTLADGTSFSQEVPLSGAGDLPVYGNLYNSTGLLLGWLGMESGSPTGNLTWIKPASRPTALYTNGFTNLVVVQGSPWICPLPNTAAIDLPSGRLEISGGSLLSPLSFNAAVSANDALLKLPGSAAVSLTGSINRATGLLTITFDDGDAMTTGTGTVLQNVTNAAGFFLGRTHAGSIILKP